ncbi:Dynein heavy chain 6, axonemal [Sparganum proliferum]
MLTLPDEDFEAISGSGACSNQLGCGPFSLEEANQELDVVVSQLREKQAALKEVEDKIAQMQAIYDKSVAEKKALEHNLALTAARLKRAGKLTTALADEKERWIVSVGVYDTQLGNLIGDVFIAAACVAYYGAFTTEYRASLVDQWVTKCNSLEIPVTDGVGLFAVLGDAFELRQWNSQGLPRDQVSTENAILVTRSRRWPLMIDPQEQANRWIRNKEVENGLKIVKSTDTNMLRVLESCIRVGSPMLLEDVGESLDPSLEPVLLRQTFIKGGRLLIRLGDSDVDYDKKFQLYITTKLPNPHYMPEVAIKVTLINFTVTPTGLGDQLLGEVTRLERPELEEARVQLIVHINADKTQLQQIEDKILKLLFESKGNILDNEALINTLNESKTTSAEINKRLVEAEATEEMITTARSKYTPIAARGSVLYFVIATLADIDPMYQFSLKYFKSLFNLTIEKCPKDEEEDRAEVLIKAITLATYNNVARGLFERDKLVFSFMLCAKVFIHDGLIEQSHWDYLISCMSNKDRDRPEQPADTTDWLSSKQWKAIADIAHYLPDIFQTLPNDVNKVRIWVDLRTPNDLPNEGITVCLTPPELKLPDGDWNQKLTNFQKLILVAAVAEEQFIAAVTEFVRISLGKPFIEAPAVDLPLLYADMDNVTPLVFVLSPGSDPMSQFQRFAKEMNYLERIQAVSLGQGQGPTAEKLMEKAAKTGDWVFLQNCHLAASWMLRMEEIIKERAEDPTQTHESFRLYLSSMPAKSFPIGVLQNSVKVTNEPPKGIKANVRRALNDMSNEYFEDSVLGNDWRKVVFGICLFHAVILERRKFGPLGWNIRYEFNDSDRECALLNLNLFCGEKGVAWDALTYITSEITYGGRVTDAWDQRCLRTILMRFFAPKILDPGFKFSESGIFYPPDVTKLADCREYVETFPIQDSTELFAMHENANLVFQQKETRTLLRTILEIQPKAGGGEKGQTPDDIVFDLAGDILARLPEKIDIEQARADHFTLDSKGRINSLTTVLTQEVDRYNKLLQIMKVSLEQLQKAVKGFVVMSEQLEMIYFSFLLNSVPEHWANSAYPSLKPLSGWVKDLILRCEFIRTWMISGQPKSFWISGFFFPQGFLTGILQNYARKYDLPIDHLSFDFTVYPQYRDQAEYAAQLKEVKYGETLPADATIETPKDGVLIHGLLMDGFRWDDENQIIADSVLGELLVPLPIVHMKPEMDFKPDPRKYIAPLYKTSVRAGVLSTTGKASALSSTRLSIAHQTK